MIAAIAALAAVLGVTPASNSWPALPPQCVKVADGIICGPPSAPAPSPTSAW